MSTDLEAYAAELPDIYRDILAVFPTVDPGRKMGYGLAFQTIMVALNNRYSLGQIQLACSQLANYDLIEIRNGMFAHPTPLGEAVISKISGRAVPSSEIPPLPPPPVPR